MSTADILCGEAFAIADAAVVSDVETNAVLVGGLSDGRRLYDVRPMLDPREQPPEVIDMAQQAVNYGLARGILAQTEQAGVLAVARLV
jgi:hypothetical protein